MQAPMGRKPPATTSHQWWGIDMTKVLVQGGGWAYFLQKTPHRDD